jgi:hypothetical protein
MKKGTIRILLFVLLTNNLQATSFPARLDENDLGAWAWQQHQEICEKIYRAVCIKTLTGVRSNGQSVQNSSFEETYTVFLSTSDDDPTQGKDTLVQGPLRFEYLIGPWGKDLINLKVHRDSSNIQLKMAGFYTLLSPDNKLYLKLYMNVAADCDSIPARSRRILQSINLKLYKQGMLTKSKVYKNDSFTHPLTQKEKQETGSETYMAFISTNPNEPTEGRDTQITQSFGVTLGFSELKQTLYFTISQNADQWKLNALSPAYPIQFNGITLGYMPWGFMNSKEIKLLDENERNLLNTSIGFTIEDRCARKLSALVAYKERYTIEEE